MDQADRRKAGDRAVRSALRQKGVEEDDIVRALGGLGDEAERARALATSRAGKLIGLEPRAAYRRLYGLLLRRGYGPDVARDACRNALADALRYSTEDTDAEG
jgi:regulatory protein